MKFLFLFTILYFFVHSFLLSACPPDAKMIKQKAIDSIDALLNEKPINNKPSLDPKPDVFAVENSSHILVLGGGYSPSGNQISLESNVKYFRKIRASIGLANASMHTYFADGKDRGRDLQFFDPNFSVPDINLIFAELFGKTKGIANQYRSNQLNSNGSSTIANLDQWFNLRKKSQIAGKNLIYFTGHGGKGDSKNPHNTTAYLWSNVRLKVVDFVKKLDQLPIEQSTILVMVQCYSGGFANVLFENGDPTKGLSKHARAGFFSTIQTRVAAGCTPDIREENYQEYSTSFWEALSGVSRIGKKISKPDYNSDGQTSLMEAHSYVSINSNTIDIPIKTSDILLRKFLPDEFKPKAKTPKKKGLLDKYLPEFLKNDLNSTGSQPVVKLEDFTESNLSGWANPEEKAVLVNLSKILELKEDYPGKEIKKLQEQLKKERESIEKEKKKALDQKNKYRDEIRKLLISKHPEISNPYHPTTTLLLSTDQKEGVLKIVNQKGTWGKLLKEKEKVEKLESQRFIIEKKEVKIIRLRRCIENIILAHLLTKLEIPEQIRQYNRLLTLERSIL
jgi:hypothetical protein